MHAGLAEGVRVACSAAPSPELLVSTAVCVEWFRAGKRGRFGWGKKGAFRLREKGAFVCVYRPHGEKGAFRLALHKHAMPAVGKLEKAYFKMVRPFAFNGLEPGRGCTHVRTNRTGRVSRGGGGVGVPAALGPPGLPPTRVQKESLCHGATTCRTQRRRSDCYQSRPQEP